MSDLISALSSLRGAREGHDEAESFYAGTAPEVIASTRIRRVLGDSAPFRFNYARIPVSARLARLEISSVSSPNGLQADLLERLWIDNQMAQETHDAHEAALVCGESYVIVLPGDSDDPLDVTIWHNSAKQVRLFYDPENPRRKKYAIKAWVETDGRTRANLYYPDRIERYVSLIEIKQAPQDTDFVPYVDEEDAAWPIPNPTGTLPVFHLRTRRTYGRPVHRDAFGPQNVINKLWATLMGSVDYQGLPQRYALEDAGFNGGVAALDEDFGDDTGSAAEAPELQATPGGVWWLRGIKSVGQFDVADPKVFLEPYRDAVQTMAIATDTPLHAFNVSSQMPSGESRRAAEIPLVKSVEDLQRIFGPTWQEVYAYALELMGVADPQVTVSWAPPESYEDSDAWDAASKQQAAGVPVRQSLLERGYTVPQLDRWGIPDFSADAA